MVNETPVDGPSRVDRIVNDEYYPAWAYGFFGVVAVSFIIFDPKTDNDRTVIFFRVIVGIFVGLFSYGLYRRADNLQALSIRLLRRIDDIVTEHFEEALHRPPKVDTPNTTHVNASMDDPTRMLLHNDVKLRIDEEKKRSQ